MEGTDRASNGGGRLVRLYSQELDVKVGNGFVAEPEYGQLLHGSSVGLSRDITRLYQRRNKNHSHSAEVSGRLGAYVKEKSIIENPGMDVNLFSSQFENVEEKEEHVWTSASNDSLIKQRRHNVLQEMMRSLKDEDGLWGCVRNALVFDQESGLISAVKESVHSCEDLGKGATFSRYGKHQNSVSGGEDVVLSVLENDTSRHRVTELCRRTFFDVITSEKFSLLCNVLLENFEDAKVHKIFDIAGIDSRMKEGAYEHSPVLFLSDIQQLWMRLQNVGSDIVALAKSLSEKSRTAYQDQVGGLVQGASDDVTLEFVSQESDMHPKVEETEAYGGYKVRTCKCCKGKADVRDCLICNSCEEMYHVSCIEPSMKEIPIRSWYCESCTSKCIESPHEDCVVCERLNASRLLANIGGVDQVSVEDLEESSNGLVENYTQLLKAEDNSRCHVCRTEVQSDEKHRICEHDFCPHKVYHARCLTSMQLNSYGPQWYCPSCLCRVCVTDCDDEKIVLCDACDQAYHIYCMEPPRSMIPRGKWFCKKCDSEIRLIRGAKRDYENLQNRLRKQQQEVGKSSHEDPRSSGEGKVKEPLENSAVADMFLDAAMTLNHEENRAGMDKNC